MVSGEGRERASGRRAAVEREVNNKVPRRGRAIMGRLSTAQ